MAAAAACQVQGAAEPDSVSSLCPGNPGLQVANCGACNQAINQPSSRSGEWLDASFLPGECALLPRPSAADCMVVMLLEPSLFHGGTTQPFVPSQAAVVAEHQVVADVSQDPSLHLASLLDEIDVGFDLGIMPAARSPLPPLLLMSGKTSVLACLPSSAHVAVLVLREAAARIESFGEGFTGIAGPREAVSEASETGAKTSASAVMFCFSA
eukprot:CAMPEP_0172793418 /NCGR_PEP_ID=MMETSP1074-20121228/209468_1 /TAXON_ID=2916 /ORGANISM="Ceratium fusus, Strain PA161109" /LENGTH=210 /DNA_ID=CAMNT_0013630493 /DNA_START=41 /DNA_END=674 /DNA_ORIENTATION=+